MRTKSKTPRPSIWSGVSAYGTYEGPRGNPDEWRAGFSDAWDAATARRIIREQSPWDILGISPTATLAEATKAFRRLMLIHHPDKGGDAEKARQIIAAYTVIRESYR